MSMRELDGKVALVTGAARNIGRAIALELADGGAAVAIVVRSDIAGANAVAREVEARGGRALAICADITDPAAVRRAVGRERLRLQSEPRIPQPQGRCAATAS